MSERSFLHTTYSRLNPGDSREDVEAICDVNIPGVLSTATSTPPRNLTFTRVFAPTDRIPLFMWPIVNVNVNTRLVTVEASIRLFPCGILPGGIPPVITAIAPDANSPVNTFGIYCSPDEDILQVRETRQLPIRSMGQLLAMMTYAVNLEERRQHNIEELTFTDNGSNMQLLLKPSVPWHRGANNRLRTLFSITTPEHYSIDGNPFLAYQSGTLAIPGFLKDLFRACNPILIDTAFVNKWLGHDDNASANWRNIIAQEPYYIVPSNIQRPEVIMTSSDGGGNIINWLAKGSFPRADLTASYLCKEIILTAYDLPLETPYLIPISRGYASSMNQIPVIAMYNPQPKSADEALGEAVAVKENVLTSTSIRIPPTTLATCRNFRLRFQWIDKWNNIHPLMISPGNRCAVTLCWF